MQRRTLLRSLGVGLTAGALSSTTAHSFARRAPAAARAGAQWPGHQPGRVYLGMSSRGSIDDLSGFGRLGLQRSFCQWSGLDAEIRKIRSDHAAGRLPWTSITSPGSFSSVAGGAYDSAIRARARAYAGLSHPAIVTFCHEPQTELDKGSPAQWAAAWTRVHDVMRDEAGLANVAFAPIIGEWVFNPSNRQDDPGPYLTDGVLSRMAFLGVDLYQNPSGQDYSERLGRVLEFLNRAGESSMTVGVGETGASDVFGSPSGATWWTRSWAWVEANRQRVSAVSYFNSSRNLNKAANWNLSESSAKMAAFKNSMNSSVTCRLP
jgi:hypothetical protein